MAYAINHALNDGDIDEAVTAGKKLISQILDRAPCEAVKGLIDAGAPLWFQDDDGISALHAAAYVENEELVRYLIGKGAIWNIGALSSLHANDFSSSESHPVDHLHNSAGDVALSMNNETIYTIIRDAGIRSGGPVSSSALTTTQIFDRIATHSPGF